MNGQSSMRVLTLNKNQGREICLFSIWIGGARSAKVWNLPCIGTIVVKPQFSIGNRLLESRIFLNVFI